MIKKLLVLSCFAILFMAANCDNEPYEEALLTNDNSCDLASIAAANAAEDLVLSTGQNFSLLCQVYKESLQDQIEACGDANGDLQALIVALGNCMIDEDLCEEAIVLTNIAEEAYENATDDSLENLCNAYVEALENQISLCGDDGTLQVIINDLGNCNFSDDLCEDAVAASEIAEMNYNNANETTIEDLCIEYKSALENQIEICGDDAGVLQVIIDELGDCTVADIVPIEGIWNLNFILVGTPLDINNDGQETINIYAEINCHQNEYVTFFDDGTGEFFRSSLASYSYMNNSDSPDGVDFSDTCTIITPELRTFNWERVDNDIFATFIDNGEMISFIKSPSVLSLYIIDGFSASLGSTNLATMTQDMAYVYLRD